MASFYEEDDDVGEDVAIPESMRPTTPPADLVHPHAGAASAPSRGTDRARCGLLLP